MQTLMTMSFSCKARLCLTCHAMTGGTPRLERVRNTAVPGTLGTPFFSSPARKSPTGTYFEMIACITARRPVCQTHISP